MSRSLRIDKIWRAFASTLLLVSLSSFANKTPVIYFLNWAQYLSPEIVKNFKAQTGIEVHQNYFDSDDMLNAELIAGSSGYDLALPALDTMQGEIPAGVLEPLDKSKLPNYKYIDPALYKIASSIDPGNKYGVIYDYGTTGIAYNVDLVKKVLGPNVQIDSWDFLFNPKYLKKLQSCGVAFLDDSGQVLGLSLFYLGYNPNSTDPIELRKAADYMMQIRPYLMYFDNERYIQDLASGNICVAMAYSGDLLHAQQQADLAQDNIHLKFVLPKNGAPIWFDMLVIPKNAPHPQAALAFINYMLDPKVAAMQSNYTYQPNAIVASRAYLNPVLQDPNITPPEEVMAKLFDIHKPPQNLVNLIDTLWFQVRYGVGGA